MTTLLSVNTAGNGKAAAGVTNHNLGVAFKFNKKLEFWKLCICTNP